MGKVYQSVRGIMHGTLNRKNTNMTVSVQMNENANLDDAMEALEKVVVNSLAKLKASVTDNQAAAASKVQQAEQVIEDLRAMVARLQAQLREADETIRRKEAASQNMEESLGTEIRDLQTALKQKEADLESRDSEVNNLKSNADVLTKQVSHLELAVEQAKGAAATEGHRAEQLEAKVAGLEVQLREAEDNVQRKDVASQKMAESLGAEIRDLQTAVKQKEAALESRDAEVNDLKSKTDDLAKQVSHLELAIQQAREAAASQVHRAGQAIDGLRANISALEAKLKEAEENVEKKDIAGQKLEENLGAEIRDLQSTVKQKEAALESRDAEVNDLRSKTDVLTKQVSDLELAIQQAKGAAASQAQHAGQVIDGLGAKITVLEAKLREAVDNVQKKDVASQRMAESLGAEIRDLQSTVKQKEAALKSRDAEVNDLKSTTDVLGKQVTQLELAIQQAKGAAATQAQDAGQVIDGLRAEIATLQAQLRQEEPVVEARANIKGDDQTQDRPVIGLNAGSNTPKNGIKEMPYFLSKAEATPEFQAQDFATVVSGEQVRTGEEEPVASRFQDPGVTPGTDAARETVSQDVFDRMIAEFSERANVIRSIASLITRHHVRTLGESMEEFPQTRLPELLESLSGEISDNKLKASFLKQFGKA